jgi:5-methylcytosine-specific restriction endonuclease McrA
MSKRKGTYTKKQKANRIIHKIKRYLFYEKKITAKLSVKNTVALELFFKDQGITCTENKYQFIIDLNASKTNAVLMNRAYRSPRKNTGSRKKYLDYLQSKEWQKVRAKVFEERGRICERCQKDLNGKIADVHHKTYKNLFNEKLEDLEVLCRPCHQLEHQDKRHSKDTKPKSKQKLSFKKKCQMLEDRKGRKSLKKMGYKI